MVFAGHVRLLANEVAAIIATMFLPSAWPLDFTPSVKSATGRDYSLERGITLAEYLGGNETNGEKLRVRVIL